MGTCIHCGQQAAGEGDMAPPTHTATPPADETNCRGCWEIGNNCGKCPKCLRTKPAPVVEVRPKGGGEPVGVFAAPVPERVTVRPGQLAEALQRQLQATGETAARYILRLIAEDLGEPVPEEYRGNPNLKEHAAAGGKARAKRKGLDKPPAKP